MLFKSYSFDLNFLFENCVGFIIGEKKAARSILEIRGFHKDNFSAFLHLVCQFSGLAFADCCHLFLRFCSESKGIQDGIQN